jgi:hypothetical protein
MHSNLLRAAAPRITSEMTQQPGSDWIFEQSVTKQLTLASSHHSTALRIETRDQVTETLAPMKSKGVSEMATSGSRKTIDSSKWRTNKG